MRNYDKKLDKRVAGVIRWLERFKKSYSSGAMENALMDAECARADLENLRLDVWATLEDVSEKQKNKTHSRFFNFSRVLSLSLLIVMLTSFPISKEMKIPVLENKENIEEEITLAKPIIIVREEPKISMKKTETHSDNNNVAAVKSKKQVHTANVKKTGAVTQYKEKEKEKEKIVQPAEVKKIVAYDKIFSLIQTGEKALKNNSSVIKSN